MPQRSEGPLASFITVSESLTGTSASRSHVKEHQSDIHDEFLVSAADPCQPEQSGSRVRLAAW